MRLKWDRRSAPRGTRPIGALLTGIVTGTQDRFRGVSGHAKTFIRFLRTERGKLAVPAACIGMALWGGIFLCQSILGKMLREDAQATSSAWVSMLVARNPEIFDLLAGDAPSDQTRHFLDESEPGRRHLSISDLEYGRTPGLQVRADVVCRSADEWKGGRRGFPLGIDRQ